MSHVHLLVRDGVATVTLDRPPVNALAYETFASIADTFEGLSAGRDTNVAILRSANERVFCAGVDLEDSPRRHRTDGRRQDGGEQGDPRDQLDPGRVVRRCFSAVRDCAVPVIAALDGKAIGAGTALLGCCDLVIATDRATLALTEINVGVLGGVRHAQRLVGRSLARRMFLTGEPVSAHEVWRRGGLEAVVAPEDLLPTVQALAATIAAKSPIAVRLAKESANRVEDMPLDEGYRLEQDYTSRVRRYADSDEARRATMEKRGPDFRWE